MGGGNDTSIQNPGTVDISQSNPELHNQMVALNNLTDQYQQSYGTALDQGKWDARTADMMSRNDVAAQNRFASMGIGGSSLAAGSMAEGDRQLQFGRDDQRLQQASAATKMMQGLYGQQTQNLMQGQGQFQQYQQMALQQQISDQNAQNQMWGSIMQMGGTIGGAALAGPPGAAAGGAVGGGAASTFAPQQQMPSSPTVGTASGMYGGGYGNSSYYGYGGSR